MLFTDLCLHVISSGLQGYNKTIITMFDFIKVFQATLQDFNQDLASKTTISKIQKNIFLTIWK